MDQYCSQWFYHNSIFDYLFIFIVISIRKWNFLRSMYILEFLFLVRCFQASDPTWGHVNHHRLQNSLNIDFTGIHALEHLFSIKFYERWDQDEMSRTILKIWVLIGNSCLCMWLRPDVVSQIVTQPCVAGFFLLEYILRNH